jgi:phytoene desaturase
MRTKVVVIGGGLGGLSAAIRLSRMGFPVELYEQNSSLGGKMNEFRSDGYRFDTGPSLLTMPFVLDDLLKFAGVEREDHLELEMLEPVCRYFYPDGTILNASSDSQAMKHEIRRIAPSDEFQYERFLEYSKDIYDFTANIFLHEPIHEIQNMLTWKNLKKNTADR